MKYLKLLILITAACYCFETYAVSMELSDSTIKTFQPVIAESERLISNPAMAVTSHTILEKDFINLFSPRQISEVINYTPGIYIKDYGGIGGLKTISLRGSNAQQTLIMIDGMKLNSTQSSTLDLSVLPVSIINNIEIVKGGMSSFFGSNAIGGVINIIPERISGNRLKSYMSLGSFNEMFVTINKSLELKSISFSSGIEYLSSRGNYSFHSNQFGIVKELKRDNSDFENLTLFLNASGWFEPVQFKTLIVGRSNERGVPGAVLQGNVFSKNARMNEKELMAIIGFKYSFNDSMRFHTSALFKVNDLHYADPDELIFGNEGIKNSFINRELIFKTGFNYLFDKFDLNLYIEGGLAELRGDMLEKSTGGFVSRKNLAIYSILSSSINSISLGNFRYSAGIRFDAVSDVGSALSPFAGLTFTFSGLPILLRSNWSYNFRVPSFNEMYYLNFGSRHLKPEKSHSFNAGASLYVCDFVNIDSDAFLILTNDQIVSERKSAVTWSAANMSEVLSKGVELSSNVRVIDSTLNLCLSYTIQEARDALDGSLTENKLLPYVPQEMANVILSSKFEHLTISSQLFYTSFRFSSLDNSYNSILSAYWLCDINFIYYFDISLGRIKIRVDLKNVFNRDYYVVRNYPMPGRSFRLGFSFDT